MDDIDDFDFSSPTSVTTKSNMDRWSKLVPDSANSEHFRHKVSAGRFTYLTSEEKTTDWYSLLRVPRAAKSSIIKEAYHQECLNTHPDKLKTESDDAFKMIVKAFHILGDPIKRRAYDSIGPIEDGVIKEKEYTDEEFFDVFGKHFNRISRWSHIKPPKLGDDSTALDEVDEFYEFWYDFKSWRDFSFKIEDVEILPDTSREEKRYINHECEREMNKHKRNEGKAVRSLVEKCRKADPRIKRRAKQKQSERDARILAKKLSIATMRERIFSPNHSASGNPVNKGTSECSDKKEFALTEAKKLGILETSSNDSMEISNNNVKYKSMQWLLQKTGDLDKIVSIIKTKKNNPKELVYALNSEIASIEEKIGYDRYGNVIKQAVKKVDNDLLCKADWSETDVLELQKAIISFPRGTVERWKKISSFLKEKFSPDDVLLKTKEVESRWNVVKDLSQKNGTLDGQKSSSQKYNEEYGAATWSPKQQKMLEEAMKKYQAYNNNDKWLRVSQLVDGKSEDECIQRYKLLCNIYKR